MKLSTGPPAEKVILSYKLTNIILSNSLMTIILSLRNRIKKTERLIRLGLKASTKNNLSIIVTIKKSPFIIQDVNKALPEASKIRNKKPSVKNRKIS